MNPKNILASWYTNKEVLIFGHRGASAYAPMNTIPAFELAAEQGADGIELDVHLTSDGELVIIHDSTVDHTTDGEGIVTEKSLAELKELDAGTWFSDEFSGVRIPTLGEVFEAVGEKLIINVEIKTLSRDGDGTEQAVAACIQNYDMIQSVIISSFNPYVLKRFRRLIPQVPLGYLLAPSTLTDESHVILPPSEYEALHLYHAMIDEQLLAFAQDHNLIINSWTVNEIDIALNLKSLGVRGVMSDYPDLMKKALA